MRTIRRAVVTGLLSAGLLAGDLAVAGAPALGFFGHPYLSHITEAAGVPFAQPWGLTFDSTGNLFVADARGEAVDVFNSTNAFTSQLGAGTFSQPYTRSVAVRDATGDVYVAESGPENVDVFKPEGTGKFRLLQERHFGNYMYVAVNNSGGLYGGEVYVISGNSIHVIKPNAEGELVEAGEELPPPEEGFALLDGGARNGGLAIDRVTGEVYVANPGHGVVDEYDSEDVYQGRLAGPGGSFEPVAVSVEESTGDVYVVDAANDVVDQFDASGKVVGRIREASTGPLSAPLAVAVNASGDVYVSDGGAVDIFGPGVLVPEVTTGAASAVLRTSAELDGVVNPEGNAVTSCEFEYGTSVAYGQTAACVPAPGSGSSPVAVSAEVSGLTMETTYHYRLVADNSKGVDQGADLTFTTPPAVPNLQTGAASVEEPAAGTIDATLNGLLEPAGADTHYYFEYGETEAYGSVSPALPGTDAGEAFTLEHAQVQLNGLNPDVTYHYRLVAANSFGTESGADMTFSTPGVVPGLQTEAATKVELSDTTILATLNGSLEPAGADTHYYFEYGETEAYGLVSPALPGTDAGEAFALAHAQTQLSGLAPYVVYHYRLVATNSFGTTRGADETFNTTGLIPAPTVGGLPASNVSQFAATLNGTLKTGEALVNYRFEYGTSTAYGSVSPIPDAYTPVTSATVPVSQSVSGLQAGTTYHYRLVASSPGGTEVMSPDETFTTLPIPVPSVSTGGASGVGVGSATLAGTVDPHGWDTSYAFQYGTTAAYGSSWPTVLVDMGALEGPQPVVVNVPNLLPGTTYHYRLVASNGGGVAYGPDMTFTTAEYPAAIVQEPPALRTLLVPTGGAVKSSGKAKKKSKTRKTKRSRRRTKGKGKGNGSNAGSKGKGARGASI
jgi:hypothetical protein